MTIHATTDGDTGRVTLAGRFTFENLLAFKAATEPLLADPAIRILELDLSGIDVMAPSSLGMMLVLREKAELMGKAVRLMDPAPCVRTLLEVVQFGRLFDIHK